MKSNILRVLFCLSLFDASCWTNLHTRLSRYLAFLDIYYLAYLGIYYLPFQASVEATPPPKKMCFLEGITMWIIFSLCGCTNYSHSYIVTWHYSLQLNPIEMGFRWKIQHCPAAHSFPTSPASIHFMSWGWWTAPFFSVLPLLLLWAIILVNKGFLELCLQAILPNSQFVSSTKVGDQIYKLIHSKGLLEQPFTIK